MKTQRLVLSLSISIVLLAAGVLVWRKPVLLSFAPSANAGGKPFICILNPFRDKGPEAFIETLLKKLQTRKHEPITEYFPTEQDQEFKRFMAKGLDENPLESWSLGCIVRSKNGDYSYCYSAFRKGRPEPTDIWITLRRRETGFQVINFEFGI